MEEKNDEIDKEKIEEINKINITYRDIDLKIINIDIEKSNQITINQDFKISE